MRVSVSTKVYPDTGTVTGVGCIADFHCFISVLAGHFHGVTHFGDNIQDEWFIVALLYEFTRQIPDLIVRVADSDGEFLLIEAANHLPEWASNPEQCTNKVFIMNGRMHLIYSADDITISDAVNMLSADPKSYVVSDSIEKCIHERIKGFPDTVREQHQHKANVYVPISVARLLHEKPQKISTAVQAFCNRDPIDLKVIRAMRYFPPENRVYTQVRFTRCLFAMLVHQQYTPDRRTGWQIPSRAHPDFAEHSLGMKLACGFEILAAEAHKSKNHTFDETDRAWMTYLKSLEGKGYFNGLLDGSEEHNRLKEEAKMYFQSHEATVKWTTDVGIDIVADLQSFTEDGGKTEEAFATNKADLPPPDNEDWLNVDAHELDKMLNDKYNGDHLADIELETEDGGRDLSKRLNEFLNSKSDFDGIENITGATAAKEAAPSMLIDFDPDHFGTHVKNLLDFVIPEDCWHSDDSGDMSDYDDDGETDRHNMEQDMVNGKLKRYMHDMDRELSTTTIGQSFKQQQQQPSANGGGAAPTNEDNDEFADIEAFKPVDIQMNTLANIVESYQSQLGGAGPSSNLLNSIGVQIKRAQPHLQDDTNTS